MNQTPSQYDGRPASDAELTFDPSDASDPTRLGQGARQWSSTQSPTGDTSSDYLDADRSGAATSTTDTAKQEAGKVADTGVQAAKDVAGTVKDEASNVVAEATQQAKSLFATARDELSSQGGAQQQRLAAGLHSLSKELGGMASSSEQSGPLTDLAKQAAAKGGELAHWLETHEPADLLREVQAYARRRPVAFLALCGLAGVVAGRVARGATAANSGAGGPTTGGSAATGSGNALVGGGTVAGSGTVTGSSDADSFEAGSAGAPSTAPFDLDYDGASNRLGEPR
ncbi:hypothetical protein [Micropruina sonneratiae]|uniref:hypothetical protein n=1 Tax=Micropruina sonneratiae TaxID=2986940 RepID=UPI002226F4B4|nr:hypothetical protein [Micropruina sp. KQZ13P-5]MCW3158612.1 hypothetical protein [Micropruina sp. KQZ13P-5]